MYRFLKGLGFTFGLTTLGFGGGAYYYTNGALTPKRLAVSYIRSTRIAWMAARMAFIYRVISLDGVL